MTHEDTSFESEFDFEFTVPHNASANNDGISADEGGMLADGEFGMPNPSGMPSLTYIDATEKPAEERLAILLEQMATQKPILMKVLSLCCNATPVETVYEQITELQKYYSSVFTPEKFCDLLEQAGALERVDEGGNPWQPGDSEPVVVVEDGVEYLAPAPAKVSFWKTTPVGQDCVAGDDPIKRLHELLEENSYYAPIYQQILSLCSQSGGAATKEISSQVDSHPLLKSPRFYSNKFIDHLERAGGIVWRDAWVITEEGATLLSELVQD